MIISLHKINDQIVKPIKNLYGGSNLPVLGSDLFEEPYSNIFLCAKKKSGKTHVIYKILKECAGKNTVIFFFVSTLYKDPLYKEMMKWCDNHKITYEGFTSLYEGKDDVLQEIMTNLLIEDENIKTKVEPKKKSGSGLLFNEISQQGEGIKIRQRKPTHLIPEYIFVFDDISNELKNRSLEALLKKNRHYKSKCIVSTQYLNDLKPESRKQMDYILLFKSLPVNKLEEIYRDSDLSIEFEDFVKLYKYSTQKKYSFLYIDVRDETFRINFDNQLKIK